MKKQYPQIERHTAQVPATCRKCEALEGMLEFMKLQNRELQEKLLSLVPPAMDSYMRLQMSQAAQMRPEAAHGIMPESSAIDDDGLDQFFNDITNPGKPPPRRMV